MIIWEGNESIVICDDCGKEVFEGEYEETPDGKQYCSECLKNSYIQEQ